MSPPSPEDRPTFRRIAARSFLDNPRALELIDSFLTRRASYDRDFVVVLIAEGRRESGARSDRDWEVRRLAALMLQHQFLLLPVEALEESLGFLGPLGLLEPDRPAPRLKESVLKEGYTTTEPGAFHREFRRNLGRLEYVLRPLRRRRVSARAFRDFLEASRHECKLSLARYLFRSDEVADRVRSLVRISSGDPAPEKFAFAEEEARRTLSHLPDFEAGLLRDLAAKSEVYWVGERSSSRINAAVEYPIGTVVLVVKPPGSGLEVEIKRAGRRGNRPLGIVYERDGKAVPSSHRLDGGSSIEMIQWEAGHSAALAKLFREIHRADPPIPIATSIALPETIPVGDARCEHLIDYFSDPTIFGDEFASMDRARRRAIEAFASERGASLTGLGGEWGETIQFLQYAAPAQSILVGTSSFRLDLLCRYLSPDGPRHYFEEGLKARWTRLEGRRFADELLDEVLAINLPTGLAYESHESYLEAAFASGRVRARADRVHASLVRQLGTFWGTLLGLRAFTHGESFVARNVGLKRTWARGRWVVRMVFMDHDVLHLPTHAGDHYHPDRTLPGTIIDEAHVTGPPIKRRPLSGALDHLQFLYRVDDATAAKHHRDFRDRLTRAFHKTRRMMGSSPALKGLIPARFVETTLAWDRAVALYLRRRDDPGWSDGANALLEREGFSAEDRARYLKAIEDFAPFLERLSFLYLDPTPTE